MNCSRNNRTRQTDQYGSHDHVESVFAADLHGLYQLSFLLTGNHEEAEQCFVAGLEDSVTANNVFREWVHVWAKRAIIENAVRILRPHPEVANSSITATSKLPSIHNGHFALESLLALGDFERFVFVLSVLEKYSEHESAVFLGCSLPEIRNAQSKALEQIAAPIYREALNSRKERDRATRTHTLALPPGTSHSEPFVELQQSLPSQVEAIEPFVEQLMHFISKFRKPDGSGDDIATAVHEALANAVIHGNREDPNRRVYAVCRCSIDGDVSITIRDQGHGFDSRSLPDPTAPENRMCTHGRGIYLMRASMDEVAFDEGGLVVHMRKKSNALGDRPQL